MEHAVIPDGCEDARGQKGALGDVQLGLRWILLKQHEFTALRLAKDTSRRRCVFFAHKDSMSQTAPREMLAHAAGGIRLNHRVDAGSFEEALGNPGFAF